LNNSLNFFSSYSCRKNVKRHRISQHKVPAPEAQEGFIKRIRLTEAELAEQQQQQQQLKSGGEAAKIEAFAKTTNK
jgi:hypothetical protein